MFDCGSKHACKQLYTSQDIKEGSRFNPFKTTGITGGSAEYAFYYYGC